MAFSSPAKRPRMSLVGCVALASLVAGRVLRASEDATSTTGVVLVVHGQPPAWERGWSAFDGDIFAEQPGGRMQFTAIAPHVYDLRRKLRQGTIDLCGLPW